MKHKWIQSQKAGMDLGFEAQVDWIEQYAAKFRQYVQSVYGPIHYPIKFQQYMEMQVQQIMIHKWIKSKIAGKDLGKESELEWVRLHAAEFRAYVEGVNGPIINGSEDMGLETVLNWIELHSRRTRSPS